MDSCVRWQGYINPRTGYGGIRRGGKHTTVHRYLYELYWGPVADGMQVHHICNNRWCVNVGHLREMTPRENTRQGGNAVKDVCPQGHAYDEANTYWRPDGKGRECRECVRVRSREWQRSHRGD